MMWLWLCAAVLFGAVEAVTAGLVSVWFAVGSVGAFFAALGGLSITLQLVVFAAVSAVALAATRPLVARFGHRQRRRHRCGVRRRKDLDRPQRLRGGDPRGELCGDPAHGGRKALCKKI